MARNYQRGGFENSFIQKNADSKRLDALASVIHLLLKRLDVCFVSLAPVERHARAGGHPVPVAPIPWIPAFAGMTQGCRNW